MKRILVTGSKGQIGQCIQDISTKWDFEFVFVDKEQLDFLKPQSVYSFLNANHFDYVVNCAAYTQVDKAEDEPALAEKINTLAVDHLSRICRKNGTVLIQLSTDYVYHSDHEYVHLEEDLCFPKSVYAKTKFLGEEAIKKNAEKYIILRTSWVYSKYGHNFVKTMLRIGEQKKELSIVNDQIGSPTYAMDIADAILQIIHFITFHPNFKNWGIYNYSNLGFIHWAEFAEEIFHLANMKLQIIHIPSSDYPTPANRPLNSRLSKSKVTDVFRISLKHWKKALSHMLHELKEQDNTLIS